MLPRRGWERDGELGNSQRGTRASPGPNRPPFPATHTPKPSPTTAPRQPEYCCSLAGFEQWKRHLLRLFLPSLMRSQVCVKGNYIDYRLYVYWNLKWALCTNEKKILIYNTICILAFCHSCLFGKDWQCILHHPRHRWRHGLYTRRIWRNLKFCFVHFL